MSVRVMTKVWEITLPDSEKLVLLALADCANDEGGCWPSMATLSKKCSKSERTVQGAIKALVATGHLTRNEVPGKGCNYVVHPRSDCTPAETAPPQGTTKTPAEIAGHPRSGCGQTVKEPSKKRKPLPKAEPALRPEHVVEAWNEMAGRIGLATVVKLTDKRRKALNTRIREYSIEDFTEAIRAIERSSFLKGNSKGGWRANFDFLLQPSSFIKLIEGSYDHATH